MPGERRLALGVLAVDQQDSALAPLGGFAPGANLEGAGGRLQARMDRPGTARGLAQRALHRPPPPIDLAKLGAPEAAARREERERFEQICLAGSVGAEERHGHRRQLNPRCCIAAEVREHETTHGDRSRCGHKAACDAAKRRPGQSQDAVIASHAITFL